MPRQGRLETNVFENGTVVDSFLWKVHVQSQRQIFDSRLLSPHTFQRWFLSILMLQTCTRGRTPAKEAIAWTE
jgi:hypothetical protein